MWYLRILVSFCLGYWAYGEISWWAALLAFLIAMVVSFPLQMIVEAKLDALFPQRAHDRAMAVLFGARQQELDNLNYADSHEVGEHAQIALIREKLADGACDKETLDALTPDMPPDVAIGLIKSTKAARARENRPDYLVPDTIAKEFADLMASDGIGPSHQNLLENANVNPDDARNFLSAFQISLETPYENHPQGLKPNHGTELQRLALSSLVDTTREALKAQQNRDALAIRISYGYGFDIRDVRRLFEKVL